MDIRNVQRTGNMHYVYLPTAWCKQHNISSKTKLTTQLNEDGSLILSPGERHNTKQELVLRIKEDDLDIIHKLVIASYLSPASSFRIMLDKNIDYTKLLNQKKLISLELVELNKESITCDSSVVIEDLGSLLKTMLRKIRNMLVVMNKNYTPELVARYEEEIDRSQLLLEKSVIEAMSLYRSSRLRTVELYYVSLMSRELERLVDILSVMEKRDTGFLSSVLEAIDMLKDIVTNLGKKDFSIPYTTAISFIKKVDKVANVKVKDIGTYEKRRAKEHLVNVSEFLVDWSLLYQLGLGTK